MSNPDDLYLEKAELCVEAILLLPHDAVKMLLTSINNAVGTKLAGVVDFEAWIRSLGRNDRAVIDMVASMLGIEETRGRR